MANEETVTKVVEGVDRLFDEIVVNGRTVKSAPARQSAGSTSVSTNRSEPPVQGEYVKAIQLNNVLHDIKDKALTDAVGDIATAVTNLQSDVTNLQGSVNTINSKIPSTASAQNQLADKDFVNSGLNSINSKIPAQASAQNQLADKNYVNTSISTNTANFLGTYSTLAEIEAIPDPTNNDYAYLQTQTASQLEYDRYKYNSDEAEWLFEYSLIFPIGSGAGVAFVGTRAGYETAKLIPEGEEGYIPSGALVIITDEDAYIEGEEK